MATAQSLERAGLRNAFDTVSASASDSELVAAVTGRRIVVHAVGISCGGTPSTVQFSSGGSTAVSPVFQNSISLPYSEKGWFYTAAGESLTVDTGAGSTTGIIVTYSHA
jgi:hypothetical protein